MALQGISARRSLRKSFAGPRIHCCRKLAMFRQPEGAIVVLPVHIKERLMALAEPIRNEFIAHFALSKTALLVFAQTESLSPCLIALLENYRLPAAVSTLPEHLLESRIKAFISEKAYQRISVHGVVLEIQGKGILIAGASGIGKTTAALRVMKPGYCWIADDRAVIKKNARGRLIISGHRKIQKYLHTDHTGIIEVDRLIDASQIKSRTQLAAIIEVLRTDADDASCRLTGKEILETRVPCVQMMISPTGYFDENLLEKALQSVCEVA